MLFQASLRIVIGLATLPVLAQTVKSSGLDNKCQPEQLTTSMPDGPAGGLGHGALVYQRAVTYCLTSLESMNIGGCASLERRDGRLVTVRTNLIGLVDRKQSTRD